MRRANPTDRNGSWPTLNYLFMCFASLVLVILPIGSAHASHLWPHVGKPSVQLFAGQGVNITIDGLLNFVSETGKFDVNLYFGNKLSPLDDSVANQQDPNAGPEHKFSPGDKIRVTFGGVSIVYDFDNPTNVTPQPGTPLNGEEQQYGLRLDLDKKVFLDHFEDEEKEKVIQTAAPKIIEFLEDSGLYSEESSPIH